MLRCRTLRRGPYSIALTALLFLSFGLPSAPALAQQTGVNSLAGTPLYLSAGNSPTPFVTIGDSGDVGIGTINPVNKLDVVGSMAVGTYAGSAAPANSLVVSGDVGIGKINPSYPLDVAGTGNFGSVIVGGPANATTLTVSGMTSLGSYVGIGVAPSSSYTLDLGTVGTIHAAAYYYASDARLKTNIHPIENALQTITALKGVHFDWKTDAAKGTAPTQTGFIAQDVEKVVPELVQTDANTGMKAVDYARVTPLLVNALQEQQQQIDKLTAEVESLKAGH